MDGRDTYKQCFYRISLALCTERIISIIYLRQRHIRSYPVDRLFDPCILHADLLSPPQLFLISRLFVYSPIIKICLRSCLVWKLERNIAMNVRLLMGYPKRHAIGRKRRRLRWAYWITRTESLWTRTANQTVGVVYVGSIWASARWPLYVSFILLRFSKINFLSAFPSIEPCLHNYNKK